MTLIKTFVEEQGIKHGDSSVPSKMSAKSSPVNELINRNEYFGNVRSSRNANVYVSVCPCVWHKFV